MYIYIHAAYESHKDTGVT